MFKIGLGMFFWGWLGGMVRKDKATQGFKTFIVLLVFIGVLLMAIALFLF